MKRKQQLIWEEEHLTGKTLPSEMTKESSETPSANVVEFVNFLKEQDIHPPAVILDIGCGKGRNLLYLARQGYSAYGFDYVASALKHISSIVKKDKLAHKVNIQIGEMDSSWNYYSDYFDAIVDNYSSIDIETKKGREIYRAELFRTLKPGGFAMVAVVSSEDELEKEMIEKNPGQEKNSCIWPENGKFQKDYDEEELREFYKEFTIIALKKISKPAKKLGKKYTATNYLVILQKINS